jgi:hypothetical protein
MKEFFEIVFGGIAMVFIMAIGMILQAIPVLIGIGLLIWIIGLF